MHEKIQRKKDIQRTITTEQEISAADSLLALLEDLSISDSFEIESEDTLDTSDVENPDSDSDIETEDQEYEETRDNRQFSLEYMEKVVNFARPNISFTTVQHAYPRVTHRMQLKRFREYVASNGNQRQKLKRIANIVFERFRHAREKNLPVHDVDIQRWALHEAKKEDMCEFTASHHWLFNFKKRYSICSRKVTKIVSRRETVDKSSIKRTADEFVNKVSKCISKYRLDAVLNADQSSFNYEIASNRTLSYVGEKAVYVSVNSINATTHSYTVMPIITAAGQLLNPVFVCLQEPIGRFPVTKNVFSPSNVMLTCSESGKLNKSLIEYWIQEVLDNVTTTRFLLLVDQWSSQTDVSVYERKLTKGQSCNLFVIPRKTTSTIQPCDTYFFRQWKELAKRIYHRVAIDELDVDLRSRDSIIRLQSLVHNQLISTIFIPMISYAWSVCGYIPKQYPTFSNVIEVCFSFETSRCSYSNCDESAFICCSHCRKTLCFTHFFIMYHFH
jgi:hypothetical protein